MTIKERFLNKVNKTETCWNWTGAGFSNGYGQFREKFNPTGLAHRASWKIFKGEIPDGLCVLHHCDNRLCVNPDHLFLGTKHDNSQDMISKGRHLFGQRQWASKLTPENVHEIRSLFKDGVSQKELSKKFGVAWSTISKITRAKRWKHLNLKPIESISHHARGKKCGSSKLNEESVSEMRRMRKAGLSYNEIARVFSVSQPCARYACIGQTWRHVV